MNSDRHVITYPGFAESKEARGLYTDIRAEFPDYNYHILPFYEEQPSGDRIVRSIAWHVQVLQDYMDNLEGDITLLGKCGGSRVVAYMDDEHVARVGDMVLFNPPWGMNRESLEKQLTAWGAGRSGGSDWLMPRGNGTNYVVTEDYLQGIDAINLMPRYGEIASSSTNLYIVRGLDDKVVPSIRVEDIPGVTAIDIEGGDHHLLGESRQKVLGRLALHGILSK